MRLHMHVYRLMYPGFIFDLYLSVERRGAHTKSYLSLDLLKKRERRVSLSSGLCTEDLFALLVTRFEALLVVLQNKLVWKNVLVCVSLCPRRVRTAMCCRPAHYQKAFQSAVALRVLHPHVWQQLSKAVRNFYTRLRSVVAPLLHTPMHRESIHVYLCSACVRVVWTRISLSVMIGHSAVSVVMKNTQITRIEKEVRRRELCVCVQRREEGRQKEASGEQRGGCVCIYRVTRTAMYAHGRT